MGFFSKSNYTLFELCCDCYDGKKIKGISFDVNEKLHDSELVRFVLPQLRERYKEIEGNEDDETEELQEYIEEIENGDLSNLDYICHENGIIAVPLFIAIKQENTDLVNLLLQNGADVNKSFDETCPIIYATYWGNLDIVKLLIKNGAKIDVLDEDQNPPIYWPMLLNEYERKRKIFEYLLALTDLNKKYKDQKTLLHLTIEHFAPMESIKAILKANPHLLNEQDIQGFTCLDHAYMHSEDEEKTEIIEFLTGKGGKTNIINSALVSRISNFYDELNDLYDKYQVNQDLLDESVAELINIHQAMRREHAMSDNISDCIMQELIILILYTRIEDIKNKLGINVVDNYVPYLTAYFPSTSFAFFIYFIASNITIFDVYYPKTLNLLISLESFLKDNSIDPSCRITEDYYEICKDVINELRKYGSQITENEIERGKSVLSRIQKMTGFNDTDLDESFVDKELKSKFQDYLKSIVDTTMSKFKGIELDQHSEGRLKKCYDRYNIPVLSIPLSEIVQADIQILLMGSRMEGISKNYEQGFLLNDFFTPYFSEQSLKMALDFLMGKLGKSKITINN